MATYKSKRKAPEAYADLPPLTPTQYRLMEVLSDGRRHTSGELRGCIDDELSHAQNLNNHLQRLRDQLNSVGRDVVYESSGLGSGYRLVDVET